MSKNFLTAEWRKLAMVNYAVDPELLKKHVPFKTELDLWNDTCYVSLVGFMFINTRLKGFRIPFHTTFEEVNLRFYVKHQTPDHAWRRGVVFIKEIVPKPALTFVANTIYKEPYKTLSMEHEWDFSAGAVAVTYRWKQKKWSMLKVVANKTPTVIHDGSEEEFITEHYWGYTKIATRQTSEYEVEHPRWQVYPVADYALDVDFEDVYGPSFAFLKNEKPTSVFLAEGSEIAVKEGRKI